MQIPLRRIDDYICQGIDLVYSSAQLPGCSQIGGQSHFGGFQVGFGCQQILFGIRQSLGCLVFFLLQLVFAILQLRLALRKFPAPLLDFRLAVLQLRPAVLQRFPAFFQLFLGLLHFLVNGGKYLFIDRVHLVLPDDDIHALLQQPGGADACHALDTLQLGHDRFLHICTDLRVIHAIHAHCSDHNGQHIRVQLHNDGIPYGVIPVAPDLIQALPDFQGYGIHIRCLGKFQNYHGIVFIGHGTDTLNIAHRGHGRLHRLRHRRFHGLRACSRISSHYDYIRKADVRQQIRRHPGEGHHSQNNRQNHAHQHCIGLFHTEFRYHACSSCRPTGRSVLPR